MRLSIREEECGGDIAGKDPRQALAGRIQSIKDDINFFTALLAAYDREDPRPREPRFDPPPQACEPRDIRKELRANLAVLESRLMELQGCDA